MEVYRLPVGVIPRIEGTTVFIEFVRENEDHLAAVFIRWFAVHVGGSVLVYQAEVSDVRYLSGCVRTNTIPATVMGEYG